jgi:rubrerythrin
MYTAQAQVAQDLAKKVLSEIPDEERVHVGELLELLRRLAPEEEKFLADGRARLRQPLPASTPVSDSPARVTS